MTAQLRFSRINSPGSSDSRSETGYAGLGRAEHQAENPVRYDEHRDQLGAHLVQGNTLSLNIGLGRTLLNIQYGEVREVKAVVMGNILRLETVAGLTVLSHHSSISSYAERTEEERSEEERREATHDIFMI